jgi:mannitol-1-phosphate/altronate dehydrogenase
MVDLITSVTDPGDVALVRDRFGIDDAWPVVCEPFTQWVLETTSRWVGRRSSAPACSSSRTSNRTS